MHAGKRELNILDCGANEVYADGVRADGPISTSMFNFDLIVNTYQIPENTSVLAVMSTCPPSISQDVKAAINSFKVWSYTDIITDERWKCTINATANWKNKELVDHSWNETKQPAIGDAIFGAPEAVFIGTNPADADQLYCRVTLGEWRANLNTETTQSFWRNGQHSPFPPCHGLYMWTKI